MPLHMNIVGISAYYHESACCLLRDGHLVAAAEEERFSRVKHDPRLPASAFAFCLQKAGLSVLDVDVVGYYESPVKKLGRQLWAGEPVGALPGQPWLDALRPERDIREILGFEGTILSFEHHRSHAASAFFFSGFPEAAILTVDGVGEWATTTYGRGHGSSLELFEEVEFPHSLGLLYSTLTAYLGFRVNDGEYKVMGLAPYGEPRYADRLRQVVRPGPGGQYTLDLDYFDFLRGRRMWSDRLADLLEGPPRAQGAPLEKRHEDVARSLQVVLEELLLEKVRYLKTCVDAPDLCLAGGVALNCVANGRLLREGPFERLFVQPAAGDAGGCLGAAALAHVATTGKAPAHGRLRHVFLGPSFSPETVGDLVDSLGLAALDFRDRESELIEATVDRLEAGKVVGFFHGAMEFGPRALGARSLLADPRSPDMRERLNRLVKKREAFRPFAPSVLASEAAAHFDLDHPSEFMLETCAVRSSLPLPAITHVDGSARPQTVDPETAPRYAKLISAFARRTGCPLLVNTSFNVMGEPIVCTPVDALTSLALSEIDCLILEDFVIDRAALGPALLELLRYRASAFFGGGESGVSSTLYTFI